MKPLRILLVCSFGMSTTLILDAAQKAAPQAYRPVQIDSAGIGDLKHLIDRTDVILLGPQVRYALKNVEKYGKPVAVINPFTYATADGNKLLQQALDMAEAASL